MKYEIQQNVFAGCIYFFVVSHCAGQQEVLEGVIKDAQTGLPVPYSTVIIKGKSLGCMADSNGFFSLIPEKNQVIRIPLLSQP